MTLVDAKGLSSCGWLGLLPALFISGWLILGAEGIAPDKKTVAGGRPGEKTALWNTDFAKARREAADSDRPLLVLFEGSDWCAWCKKLNSEVLSQKDFLAYAKTDLVLFVADFPIRKTLPDAEIEQNETLLKEHSIEGFPTILLLDKDGEEIGRTGYRPGGAAVYVEHLKTILDKPEEEAETASPTETNADDSKPAEEKVDSE